MNRVRLRLDNEVSDEVFAVLTVSGLDPQFERRGTSGDVISVSERNERLALMLVSRFIC